MRLRNDRRRERQEQARTRNQVWSLLTPKQKLLILRHQRPGESRRQIAKLEASK